MTRLPNPLILLVDDFDDAREIYQTYFEYHGRRILCARNGTEAIALTREHHPDVILLDLRMPGLSGTETMQRLRLDGSAGKAPIVALTAHALEDERVAALHAGFDAVFAKPILPDDLARAVDDLLAAWPGTT